MEIVELIENSEVLHFTGILMLCGIPMVWKYWHLHITFVDIKFLNSQLESRKDQNLT